MAGDAGIAAGRRGVVVRIERGLDRRRARRACVVVLYGSGGSGKKTVLDVVEADARPHLPCARLELSPHQDVRRAVGRIADAMDGFESSRYGTLHLPRLTLLRSLARRVESEAEPPGAHRRRALARDALVGPRSVAVAGDPPAPDLPDAGEAVPGAALVVFVVNVVMRVWRSRRRLALGLRPARRLLAPRRAGVWRWYERHSARSEDFAATGVTGFAAAAAREMSEATHAPTAAARDAARGRLDRLWVSALVADLVGAYPRRKPYRRLRCLLLLEDADLLSSDDNLSPLTGKPMRGVSEATDLLTLVRAELTAVLRGARSPVLIVATEQATPADPTGVDVETIDLRPMTRARATSYVAATAPQRPLKAWEQEELYDACKGHPFALRMLLEQRERERREVLDPPRATAALGRPRPGGTEPLSEVLLDGLLQRFEPEPTRSDVVDLLTSVAIPRRVTLEIFALDGVPPPDTLFRLLGRYSFTRPAGGSTGSGAEPAVVLDPLMRDLLLRRGHEDTGDLGRAVRRRHTDLRDRARRDPDRALDALHHHLALGEVDAVAPVLAPHTAGSWTDALFDELDDVCRAPGAPDTEGRASTDPVVAYVLATWALRSCTSTAIWSPERFERLAELAAVLGPAATATRRRLTALAENDVDPAAARQRGRAYRHPRQFVARRRFLALALTVPLVVAGGGAATAADSLRTWCGLDAVSALSVRLDDGLRLAREGDECVGVTASATSFTTDGGAPTAEDREIGALATAIHAENEAAVAPDEEPRPVATIVVATMLSAANEAGRGSVAAGVNELRGALLAQRRANAPSGVISPRFRVRLLLANLGGNSAHAVRVADDIVELARREPGVVGVTGMGQTRTETLEAASRLGRAGIPMVGSAPSGDGFADIDRFVQLAPSNRRQAEVMAAVARTTFRAFRPFVLWDSGGDVYSAELKDGIDQAFPEADGGGVRLLDYRAGRPDVAELIRGRLGQMCADAGPAPAPLIYAGRTNEVLTVLDQLRRTTCPGEVRILAGDDLTQLQTQGFRPLRGPLPRPLYYATFGLPADRSIPTPALEEFLTEYDEARRRDATGFATGANGHVMLAHDAVTLLVDAVRTASTTPGATPSSAAVHRAALGRPPDAPALVTGRIVLRPTRPSPDAGAEVVDKLVVVQEIVPDQDVGYRERPLPLPEGPAVFGVAQ